MERGEDVPGEFLGGIRPALGLPVHLLEFALFLPQLLDHALERLGQEGDLVAGAAGALRGGDRAFRWWRISWKRLSYGRTIRRRKYQPTAISRETATVCSSRASCSYVSITGRAGIPRSHEQQVLGLEAVGVEDRPRQDQSGLVRIRRGQPSDPPAPGPAGCVAPGAAWDRAIRQVLGRARRRSRAKIMRPPPSVPAAPACLAADRRPAAFRGSAPGAELPEDNSRWNWCARRRKSGQCLVRCRVSSWLSAGEKGHHHQRERCQGEDTPPACKRCCADVPEGRFVRKIPVPVQQAVTGRAGR